MKFLYIALGALGPWISFAQAYRPAQTFDDVQLRDDLVIDKHINYPSAARLDVRDATPPLLSERELLDNLALRNLDSVLEDVYPVRRLYHGGYPSTRDLVEENVYDSRALGQMDRILGDYYKVIFTSHSDRGTKVYKFDIKKSAIVGDMNYELGELGYDPPAPMFYCSWEIMKNWQPLSEYAVDGVVTVTDFLPTNNGEGDSDIQSGDDSDAKNEDNNYLYTVV